LTACPNTLSLRSQVLATYQPHLAVARKAAFELMTLLQNDNKALPLSDKKIKELALVGPQATIAGLLFGNYAGSANSGM